MTIPFKLFRWRGKKETPKDDRPPLHYFEHGKWTGLCGAPIAGKYQETDPINMVQEGNPYCSACRDRLDKLKDALADTSIQVVIV